jgi:hypothetical protein
MPDPLFIRRYSIVSTLTSVQLAVLVVTSNIIPGNIYVNTTTGKVLVGDTATTFLVVNTGDYVEVLGSPFTLTAVASLTVTGLEGYRDVLVIGDELTSTVANNRLLRVGNSGGIITTAVYTRTTGASNTFVGVSDYSASARGFMFEVIGFNTTNPTKPVVMACSSPVSALTHSINDASSFDRVSVIGSGSNTMTGTVRVFGRV